MSFNLPIKKGWVIAIATSLLFVSCKKGGTSSDSPSANNAKCISGKGVTDIDGNVYTSVIIGNQEWLVENLKVTHYRNGVAIPNVTDGTQWQSATTGEWCYYNNDPQYNAPYGKLYNWYTVNDARGLAPTGWHIPTSIEWQTLINYAGGQQVAGAKLKEVGIVHWNEDNYNSTNQYCFTGLPGGNTTGSFIYLGQYGYWWSSSTVQVGLTTQPNSVGLSNNPTAAVGNDEYYAGHSVRCIKD